MKENPINKINLTEQSDRDLFVPVYLNFLHSKKLTGKEKLIYICLKSFLAVGSDNGKVFPSIPTICEMVDMSEPTVTKLLHSLRKKGVLEIKRQGLNKPNLYTLHDRKSLWTDDVEDKVEPTYELEKAKKLLEAAGYSVTKEEPQEEKIVPMPEREKKVASFEPSNKRERISKKQIKKQIEYSELVEEVPEDVELINMMVEVIDDAMDSDTINIGKKSVDKEIFIDEIKKLNKDMIMAVINKFKSSKAVKNPKAYILAMLYHQPGVHFAENINQNQESKNDSVTNSFHGFEQRTYDYDDLERRLREIQSNKDHT